VSVPQPNSAAASAYKKTVISMEVSMLTRWIKTPVAPGSTGISGQAGVRARWSRLRSAITAVALATGLTALASLPAPATAGDARQGRQVAYITNQDDNTVSAIDVATNTTIAPSRSETGPGGWRPALAGPGSSWPTNSPTRCR